jgi:CRP-like cAMP-binding protein
MNDPSVGALLQQQPFASEFNPAQVAQLSAIARRVHFEPGHVIFDEGEDCSEFYLIVAGRVALEMAPQAKALRVETLSNGDELGWSSVLQGKGKLFRARALIPVDALVFDGHRLREMCEQDPGFGYHLMRRLLGVVSERLQATRLQVLDMYWPAAKRAGT